MNINGKERLYRTLYLDTYLYRNHVYIKPSDHRANCTVRRHRNPTRFRRASEKILVEKEYVYIEKGKK